MKLLFVNACPRAQFSRTLELAHVFLDELTARLENVEITTHDLTRMRLQPVDASLLARKEALCDASAWDDPLFAPAVQLKDADMVLIAAPYWDLSFPSILKIWVENMYVRKLTFRYQSDRPVGLCSAGHCVYLTTAGSAIGDMDFGSTYIAAVMRVFGIRGFDCVAAERLDLDQTDVGMVMTHARDRVRQLARRLAHARG